MDPSAIWSRQPLTPSLRPQAQYPSQAQHRHQGLQEVLCPQGCNEPYPTSPGFQLPVCPQPRRLHETLSSTPYSPLNCDDGSLEIRELFAKKPVSFWAEDHQERPLSSLSTCAGPSPGPNSSVPTPTPPELPIQTTAPATPKAGSRASNGTQDRKVFVGGVPQNMTNNDMNAVFSAYGPVKKAWLQKCRSSECSWRTRTSSPQNHRGFGFVIFNDEAVIEGMLGPSNNSCFITLWDGKKLEVKRAVSSSKTNVDTARGNGKARGSGSAEHMLEAAPTPIRDAVKQAPEWAHPGSTVAVVPPLPQTQDRTPASAIAIASAPPVRATGAPGAPSEGPRSSACNQPSTSQAVGGPDIRAAPVSAHGVPAHQGPSAHALLLARMPFLADISSQELATLLRSATPDKYED